MFVSISRPADSWWVFNIGHVYMHSISPILDHYHENSNSSSFIQVRILSYSESNNCIKTCGGCQTHYDYGANTFIAICVPTGIFTALFQHLLQFAMESPVNGCYISVCRKSRASACHFLVSSSASLEHVKKSKCCHESEM